MLIDSGTHTEIIQSLSDKLMRYYIFPDVAGEICIHLQKHLEDGDYTDITEGELFALALTLHMQEINHDEHLWVRWHKEPLPNDEGCLRHNKEWQEEQMSNARLDNFGFHKVERLPGNVGYLDIHYFHRPDWGGDTAVAVMNFLAHSNALIVDLRNCTGGYPGMIALICSYLFGEEPIHLASIYWHDENITQQYWTLPHVSGKRFGDHLVYVLTSKVTFSAGEEFASILQTRKRAIVIGDKTDGGAHPGASYRLHPHFEIFIPIGRAINPITGTDFEGIGVTPDILAPQEHAFLIAYQLALQSILTNLGEAPSESYKALVEEARTALKGLARNPIICPRCGSQNLLYRARCENCDAPLPDMA